LPPLHDFVHESSVPSQLCLQRPPLHVNVQVAPAAHVCVQPPPEQSKLQVAPAVHACAQSPPGQTSFGVPTPSAAGLAVVLTEQAIESVAISAAPKNPKMRFMQAS
jgi:hypothetical protein